MIYLGCGGCHMAAADLAGVLVTFEDERPQVGHTWTSFISGPVGLQWELFPVQCWRVCEVWIGLKEAFPILEGRKFCGFEETAILRDKRVVAFESPKYLRHTPQFELSSQPVCHFPEQ
jgi:hypothetical protein